MSQEKVELKKEKKRNASKLNSQRKARRFWSAFLVVVIVVAAVGWIGYSVYAKNAPAASEHRIAVDRAPIDDYLYPPADDEAE